MSGWEGRVYKSIYTLGCNSVYEFLKLFPGEPYVAIARRIPIPTVPVHLIKLQMEEARQTGHVRDAAMDALVRSLNRSVPLGWGVASNADFEHASAYTDWLGILKFRARMPELEAAALRVFEVLKALPPPKGWHPSAPNDPLIAEAFIRGWPPADRNSSMKT